MGRFSLARRHFLQVSSVIIDINSENNNFTPFGRYGPVFTFSEESHPIRVLA